MFATILICCAWLISFFIFLGVGVLGNICFRLKTVLSPVEMVLLFWRGFVLSLVVLQLWHVFYAINIYSVFFIASLGLLGLLFACKDFFQVLKKICLHPVLLVAFSCLAFFVANRCLVIPSNCDSITYHLLAINWAAEYPLVTGIANLVPHLGFNSAYFLYVALFEIMKNHSHNFANGLLVFSVILYSLVLLVKLKNIQVKSHSVIIYLYYIFFLPVLANKVFFANMTSPSPDCPVFLLGVLCLGEFIKFLFNENVDKNNVFSIVIFSLGGMLVKQSFIVMGGSLIVLTFFLANKRQQKNIFTMNKRFICYFGFIVFALSLWCYRGVIKSGYPFFPANVAKFNVQWRVPDSITLSTLNTIKSWARQPRTPWPKVLASNDWVLPWLKRTTDKLNFTLPVCIFVISISGLFIRFIKLKNISKECIKYISFFSFPLILNVIYWFFMAPDVRFAGATFWSLGIGAFAVLFYDIVQWQKLGRVIGLVFLCLIILRQERHFIKYSIKGDYKRAQEKMVRLFSNGDNGWFYEVPKPNLKRFQANTNMELYTPKTKRQNWYGGGDKITTPLPEKNLTLRDKQDVSKGFKMLN